MALTPAEKLTIKDILGTTLSVLESQITSLGATLDADAETYIRTQLTRWVTAGADFVGIEPKERNFGARINPESEKNDIRGNIARTLEWPYAMTASASMGTLQIG